MYPNATKNFFLQLFLSEFFIDQTNTGLMFRVFWITIRQFSPENPQTNFNFCVDVYWIAIFGVQLK